MAYGLRASLTGLSIVVLAGCGGTAPNPVVPISGIDRSGFDEATRPQDDFHRYVNGGWIDRTPIPPDKSRWGSFNLLREDSDARLRAILEELTARTDHPVGSDEAKLAALYGSLMDEARAETVGTDPLAPLLARIDAVSQYADLFRLFAELNVTGVTSPLAAFIGVDSGDATRYAVFLTQAGLGLPNRNYYLREGDQFDEIRARYPQYVAQLLTLAGVANADDRARRIYDLERRIADAHWPPEDTRDATKTNNRIVVEDLPTTSPAIPWSALLEGAGLADRRDVFVRQPSYAQRLGELLTPNALDDWKDYLRFHTINAASPWLSQAFVNAQFEFYGKLINGLEAMEPRWQRAVGAVDRAMGEAVGRIYVERHFPPAAKARMDALVQNLLNAFEVSIASLDWMSDATKANAQEKRAKFTSKIGYPDTWRDYGTLEIARDDAVGNLARASRWDYERERARIDGPVDRGEWGMTPQTVNAYHNPRMNEIVFPAAILQPPFFDVDADDAVNYGAIGAVIGHEIGHAFDDQGRKTDGDGNLNDWWTDADATAFTERAEALVAAYNAFEVLPDLTVNGQLTLGENIGDLTGLYIGYLAYHMSLDGVDAPVIDGFTGDQRLMIGFAQIWRDKARDEALRRQVLTDPHSPSRFRANGPLRNFDPFYEAFDVHEGDGMYLPPEARVKIW